MNRKNTFASKFEALVAKQLTNNNVRWEYESKQIYYRKHLKDGGCLNCNSILVYSNHTYYPDFYLPDFNIYIETKGRFTTRDRKKIELVLKQNKNIDLRFIFMQDNWLTKSHRERYSDWCKEYTVPYGITKVPFKEWGLTGGQNEALLDV